MKAAVAPPSPPNKPEKSLAQEISDDTLFLAKQYADQIYRQNVDPYVYWYRIEGCGTVSGDTGRCLIYLWKQTWATGYGYGGVDRGVFREYFFATRYASRKYQTRIIPFDFVDAYVYVCSDTPRYNTPACSPNGPYYRG